MPGQWPYRHPPDIAMTRTAASMLGYSLCSALMGLGVIGWQVAHYAGAGVAQPELLFLAALALFHFIYAIWFWKGRELLPFARASVWGRLLMAGCYLGAASLWRHAALPTPAFAGFFLRYLTMQGTIDLLGALLTALSLTTREEQTATRPPLHAEGRNRAIFAAYMTALGIWILLDWQGFGRFFHLPASALPASPWLPGPLQLLGAQIVLLAGYNAVAVRQRLQPLIEAGIRGGLFTCVFMLALVLLHLLHPLVLLLPAADLISVGWMLTARLLHT
jgi:hypothetical protein